MTNEYFKNCTGICKDGKKKCNCDFMPKRYTFLSKAKRQKIEQNENDPWRYPYEPWVIETWKLHIDNLNCRDTLNKIRETLSNPDLIKKRYYNEQRRKK
jgi:hypothetical protein